MSAASFSAGPAPGPNSRQATVFQPATATPSKAYTFDAAILTQVIPSHLLSTAAPPLPRITLQLPPGAEDLDRQLLRTRLSHVYKACPHLFAQPISNVNDTEISLPWPPAGAGSPGGMANPAQRPQRAMPPGGSPFLVVEKPQAQAPETAAGSPFRVVSIDDQPTSSEEFGSPAYPRSAPMDFNPFDTGQPAPPQRRNPVDGGQGAVRNSPFKPIIGAPKPPAPASAPVDVAFEPEPAAATPFQVAPLPTPRSGDEADLVFGLGQLLSRVDPQELQMYPSDLPPTAKARLPLEMIKAQLASGRVTVTLEELLRHVDPASRAMLARGNPDFEISIPLKEIFHQLPSLGGSGAGRPSPAPPAANGAIETPFSARARQERQAAPALEIPAPLPEADDNPFGQAADALQPAAFPRQPAPAPPQAAPRAAEANPFVSENRRFASNSNTRDVDPFAAARARSASAGAGAGAGAGSGGFGGLQSGPKPPPVESAEEVNPFSSQPTGTNSRLDSLDELGPPATPRRRPQTEPAPAAAAVASGSKGVKGLGFDAPMQDIELRALFGTDEAFTVGSVLDRTRALPGIEGVVVVRDGVVADQRTSGEGGYEQLARQTPAIYSKVRSLAADIGFSSSEAFTLQTDRGVVSFFAEGETCLSVLHRGANFEPGVREKSSSSPAGSLA